MAKKIKDKRSIKSIIGFALAPTCMIAKPNKIETNNTAKISDSAKG